MTTPRDPDRLIREYLTEGPSELPDRTYEALRGDIDRTRQRVVIGPWRESHMNNIAKVAIALAAVVVVAVAGLNLLPGQGGSGSIGPSASPLASPLASTSPGPSPSPSGLAYLPPDGPLEAGTYDVVYGSGLLPFSFTVPAGWSSSGWFLTNDADINLRLTFSPVGNLYDDPCQGTLASPPIGPSVDDLTAGLVALPGTTASTTQDVVLDGRDATLVEYTIREDLTCAMDRFYLLREPGPGFGDFWTFPPYGDIVRTWIVDVDGERFVMMADIRKGLSAADQAELQDVIDSVTFGG